MTVHVRTCAPMIMSSVRYVVRLTPPPLHGSGSRSYTAHLIGPEEIPTSLHPDIDSFNDSKLQESGMIAQSHERTTFEKSPKRKGGVFFFCR